MPGVAGSVNVFCGASADEDSPPGVTTTTARGPVAATEINTPISVPSGLTTGVWMLALLAGTIRTCCAFRKLRPRSVVGGYPTCGVIASAASAHSGLKSAALSRS